MVLLSVEKRSVLLPNHLESWTLKNPVQFICNSQCVQTLLALAIRWPPGNGREQWATDESQA